MCGCKGQGMICHEGCKCPCNSISTGGLDILATTAAAQSSTSTGSVPSWEVPVGFREALLGHVSCLAWQVVFDNKAAIEMGNCLLNDGEIKDGASKDAFIKAYKQRLDRVGFDDLVTESIAKGFDCDDFVVVDWSRPLRRELLKRLHQARFPQSRTDLDKYSSAGDLLRLAVNPKIRFDFLRSATPRKRTMSFLCM
jgi:hypothetical protein